MSRIEATFRDLRASRRTGLITYITAGDPDLPRSAAILQRLDASGVDVLEVGVPFSDPLADGPVIQRATERALASKTSLPGVLAMIESIRPSLAAPIVIFSYANPILRMGLPEFVARARQAGVDGVLTLDLPPEEAHEFHRALADAGIDTIFLLSPTTTDHRIRRAASFGSGFLYGISRLGVTGARESVADSAGELSRRVREQTDMPLALGFGISTPEQVRAIAPLADAAVVGSGLVQVIADGGGSPRLLDDVEAYVQWLRQP